MSVLGKRSLNAYLHDTCTESSLVVQRSVSGVVEGKVYNWDVGVNKCIFEGHLHLYWKGFSIRMGRTMPDLLRVLQHY